MSHHDVGAMAVRVGTMAWWSLELCRFSSEDLGTAFVSALSGECELMSVHLPLDR